MATSTNEYRVNQLLLVWSMPIPDVIRALFTMVFMDISALAKYACEVLTKIDTFHLIMHLDCLDDLQRDCIYQFPQFVQIKVICDNISDKRRAKRRFYSTYTNVQFCTIDDLLVSLERAELDIALFSSDSIDESTKDAIISLIEARISAKRSSILIRRSQVRKRCTSTLSYGFPVKNTSNFAPSLICPSCELVYQQPYQLECGHQLCRVCVNTQKSCLTCFQPVSPDKALLNQVLQTSMQTSTPECSNCDWSGSLKDYLVHLKQNHNESITCLIRNRQDEDSTVHQQNLTTTDQGIYVGNLSFSDSDTTVKSLNGTCIWEISNIEDIKNDATSGRQRSIYSAPFYIFPNGYKMCLRLFINGDRKARGTHMSLFFVIMRGENDSQLQWPFKFKVTFSLIDQSTTNDGQHYINKFCWPDTTATCFERPNTDMNIGFGIPMFCPLQLFTENQNRFVQNDTAFFKVEIDLLTERPALLPMDGKGELPADEEPGDITDDNLSSMICHSDTSH